MDFIHYVEGNKLHLCAKKEVDINQLKIYVKNNKHIKELILQDCNIGNEGAKALAKINLTNLTRLDLSSNKIDKEGAKALAKINLTNLTRLDLSDNNIGKEGIEALANLTNLTELYLAKNNIGKEETEALAKVNLTNLTRLDLSSNKIDKEGAKALAKVNLPNLTRLDLSSNNIGNEGAKALAKVNLTNLTRLDLSSNKIDKEGAKALAKVNLSNLTRLDLSDNNIGKEGIEALANGNLTNLTELYLFENKIGKEGIEALANGNLTNLTHLYLFKNNIGAEGAKALANGNLTNLTHLDLISNNIDNEGAKALANGNLTNLTSLHLNSNDIGGEGIKALADGNLTNLTKLHLEWNNIDVKGAKALAESEKYCEFIDKTTRMGNKNKDRDFFKLLKESWSQARAKSKSNVRKLDESTIKSLFSDLAQSVHTEGIKVLLDDSDKYPFLVNCVVKKGYTLSYFYNHDPEMQKFFFERGMIPEQGGDDSLNDHSLSEEDIKPFLEGLAKNLVQHAKLHSELKKALEDFAMCKVNINDPEEITFEQQKILAEINKYFYENIKEALPNYDRNIPNNDEYKLIIEKLSEIKVMQDFARKPSNQQENITREEENNTQLVPKRLHSETSVVATDQTNGIQNNNQQPGNLNNDDSRSKEKNKRPTVCAFTLAIAGIVSGIAIAVYSGMLAVGIAVGVCCLIAAAVIYCCNSPSNLLKDSNVEIVVNQITVE